ncbi:MAG: M18 family aminopeptidase [Egibacteraceae bacterium]
MTRPDEPCAPDAPRTDDDLAADLCAFVDAGPSPFHVVAEMARRLDAAGYRPLAEEDAWTLAPGDRRYVVRDGGSLIAFRVGTDAPAEAGLRLVGTHTDSPTFRLRPTFDVRRHGYRLAGVEPYGGVLYHTWFDRDLDVAGRLLLRPGTPGARPESRLALLDGGPLRIPSLAIHLDRSVRTEGLKPDPQRHLVPVAGLEDDALPPLLEALAASAGRDGEDVLAHDLVLADAQPASRAGSAVRAGRLDNLSSCHAGLHALLAAEPGAATAVLVANDHEEVGSGSAEGAAGSFLADVVDRLVAATGGDREDRARAVRRSLLVSCDTAHAVHPNYADRHEPSHQPALGGGPVVKSNAGQAYATDAASAAGFLAACAQAGVRAQHYVSRADLPCGSTIGPLTATRLGLPTVDVGAPILSMHSIREQADARDIGPLLRALAAHLSA